MTSEAALPSTTAYGRDRAFEALVNAERMPTAGKRRPSTAINASEVAGCLRAQWYSAKGFPEERRKDDGEVNRLALGNAVEHLIVRWLDKAGFQGREQAYVFGDLPIRGSIDYLARVRQGKERVNVPIEIKSINENGFKYSIGEPKVDHFYQLQSYLIMGPQTYVEDPFADYGYLVYFELASKGQIEWAALKVPRSAEAEQWIRRRCAEFDFATTDETPPERPTDSPENYFRCAWCPFKKMCWKGT